MTAPRPLNDGVPGLSAVDLLANDQRQQAFHVAWDAYLGNLPDSVKAPQNPEEPNVNVKANRMGPIVDTGLYYLVGLPLKLEIDEDSARAAHVDPEQAQEALEGCWGSEDDMMTLLARLGQNGGVFGHLFARLMPPNTKAGRPYARLVVLDPQRLSVVTDPDDCDVVRQYVIEYEAPLPDAGGGTTIVRKRQVIARRDPDQLADAANTDDGGDPGDSWTITKQVRFGTGGDWQPDGTPVPWPHPWSPLVDAQNLPISNQHWGLPDLTPDLIQLNRVLNFVLSNINSIGLSHGHPWIWSRGADLSQVVTAPGGIIQLQGEDASLNALIANGDIAGLMQYAADLRSSMDEQSKVPGVATGRITELPRGQMSGVALRMLYQPLLFKTTFKRRTYGALIREASTRMLALCGLGDGTLEGGVQVHLHWQDPMPADDVAEAQTATAWNALGVSKATLMSQAGFDPDTELQKSLDEQQQQTLAFARGQGLPPATLPPPSSPDAPLDPTVPAAPAATAASTATQAPPNTPPPVNHPAAVQARQAAQVAAGKAPTPGGRK